MTNTLQTTIPLKMSSQELGKFHGNRRWSGIPNSAQRLIEIAKKKISHFESVAPWYFITS